MNTRHAIETALNLARANPDQISDEQGGLEQFEMWAEQFLDQIGTEDLDPNAPNLCDLCDIVMHG